MYQCKKPSWSNVTPDSINPHGVMLSQTVDLNARNPHGVILLQTVYISMQENPTLSNVTPGSIFQCKKP